MMGEYIKREDAIDAVLFALVGTGYQSRAIYAIRDIPSADVVPKSEVEKIFEEIENLVHQRITVNGMFIRLRLAEDIAELKKKYTEV